MTRDRPAASREARSAGPSSEPARRTATYYGWRIVAVAFVTHCLTVGTVFYSFGVFFHPLTEEFGWSRAEISIGFSLASILGAVYAPFLGWLVDRYGPRPVQLFGASVLGVAYAMLAGMRSIAEFYVAMGSLVALGAAALGPLSGNTAVANWFIRRRGRALGFSTAGISMGGVVFVPLTQWMIDRFGWRGAFLGLSIAVVGVGIPPIALWMRRAPEDLGLLPDGIEPRRETTDPGHAADVETLETELERSWTPREAIRSRNFWLIAVAFGLTIGGLSAVLLHQIPYLLDRGVAAGTASWVLGATALVGVVGKLGFGNLIDR